MKFVTGATGFTGAYFLYRLVQQNQKVRALKREKSSLSQTKLIFDYMAELENKPEGYANELLQKVEWVNADITDFADIDEAMNGVGEVYHCAALVTFQLSEKPLMEEVNIGGTARLIDLALEKNVKKFVFVSSIAALPRKHGVTVDESFVEERPAFSSPYSETKYRSEMEVWRGKAEGLNVLVVNPGIILGPCEFSRDEGTAAFFNNIARGMPFYPQGGNAFVDVRDVVDKTLKLSELNDAWGHRYIMISQNLPFKEVMSWIAKGIKRKPPAIKAKPWTGYLGYGMDRVRTLITGGNPRITPSMIYTASQNFYYDNSRVKGLLNEDFMPVKRSIDDSCLFFLRQQNS